jgi:hypothetical protein
MMMTVVLLGKFDESLFFKVIWDLAYNFGEVGCV